MEKEKLIRQISEGDNIFLQNIQIPEQYIKDLDVAKAIAKKNGYYLYKVDKSMLNKEVMLMALNSNFASEKYVLEELYDDKDIVLFIVNKNGHLLWKVSERLVDDIDVVVAAVKNDPAAIRFASKRLKDSQELQTKLCAVNEEKQNEEEKYKMELENKVNEFKLKPIWWYDEKIVNSEKLENIVTIDLIEYAEKKLGYKFPTSYLELLNEQNGGRLIKRYYYLPEYHNTIVFEVDSIFGIGKDDVKGIVKENYCNVVYINKKNVIIFGKGEGHIYYLFDYSDLTSDNEPKVIYYDEEKEMEIEIATNFKQFINNLKIREEIDLIYW